MEIETIPLPLIKSPVVFTSSDLTFNYILRKINVWEYRVQEETRTRKQQEREQENVTL